MIRVELLTGVRGRLLQQIAQSSAAGTGLGTMLNNAGVYVIETFQGASIANKTIIIIVLSLCGCLVVFLCLLWISEHLANRRKRAKECTTPTMAASPVSVDLESPSKIALEKINEEVLYAVSSNKSVQMLIDESQRHDGSSSPMMPQQGERDHRRQLNLKLRAAPNLRNISRKKSNSNSPHISGSSIVRKRSVTRKGTYGANDHVLPVRPLSPTDLTVTESIKCRDISKKGWVHNPHAKRTISSGVNTPVSTTGIEGTSTLAMLRILTSSVFPTYDLWQIAIDYEREDHILILLYCRIDI